MPAVHTFRDLCHPTAVQSNASTTDHGSRQGKPSILTCLKSAPATTAHAIVQVLYIGAKVSTRELKHGQGDSQGAVQRGAARPGAARQQDLIRGVVRHLAVCQEVVQRHHEYLCHSAAVHSLTLP